MELGHEVRLVPPVYVKPFVRRQKNDAADAEAICEAATRPTMLFVPVKSEEQQSRCMVFRTLDLQVRQRTQTVNALRGHLAEFGIIAPQGIANVERLAIRVAGASASLPGAVREMAGLLLEQIGRLGEKIRDLEKRIRTNAGSELSVARKTPMLAGSGTRYAVAAGDP